MAVKRLGELTVDELKKELKKRGLELNGDRNELMARLKKALSDEKKSQVSQLPAAGNSSMKEKIPAAAVNQPARRDAQAEATKSMEYAAEPVTSSWSEERSELEYSGAEFGAGANSSVLSSEYESGSMTCKEEEAARKASDDPPLDLMVDESQNDFDDDIVCVSVTPGKGFRVPSDGQTGRGDARKIEGKSAAGGAERTTPNQGSNTGSAENRKISGQGDTKDLSIWISGLSPACRAADLKALFNKCGKVTGAKIVASAKAPASKCFGIVTMSSHGDVLRCLKELNGTTLHGNTLALELYSGRRTMSSAKTSASAPTPTLWVTGIGLNTKAADLKKLFLPHGKVVAATIVMNPASGGARRGLIKMATCEEADVCVQKLNKTMYAGHSIEVERAKGNATQPAATSKPASKPATNQPPPLVAQKSSPSAASKPRSSFYGSSSSTTRRNRSRDRSNRFRGARPRRAFSGPSRRMDREDTAMANRAAFQREREMLLMQQQREREMKAKQAELVRAFQMECDRRKQKEEADRIAYEREQLEIDRMKLERERIEAERLKLQLEQERRQYEREQLERSRNEMFENESRMPPKRSVEQSNEYWDYLTKKRRDSPAQPGMQGRDSGHDSYDNASSRLQQMATYGEGRPGDNRIKESIPGGGGGSGGVGGSGGGGAGNRPTGSMFHNQANSSADSGKSEWKSLYNMSADGGGSNSQGQWKPQSSSSLGGGGMNGRQFGSMSSFRDRPYQEDQSPGFGSGGFKGGFGAGRGGNKWR